MTKKEHENALKNKKEVDTLIYCGPSIPGGALQEFSVFKNGVPAYIAEHTAKCPEILRLFKPTNELAVIRRRREIQGTAEHQLYQKVAEYIKED